MTEIFDDVKSRYVFEAPCVELSPFVEYYWESFVEGSHAAGSAPFTIKLFPSWTPTLSINLGSPFEVVIGKDDFALDSTYDVVHGRTHITTFKYDSDSYRFGVKLFPGTLGAFFNIDPGLFEEELVPLQRVISHLLIMKIKAAASFSERVALLQDYLLTCRKSTACRKHSFGRIQDALHFHDSRSACKNHEIASAIFTTQKTLYRSFISIVGATPKQYFSVVQARTALTTYFKNRDSFDPMDFGYYDWSHFHKAAFRFMGRRLTQEGD